MKFLQFRSKQKKCLPTSPRDDSNQAKRKEACCCVLHHFGMLQNAIQHIQKKTDQSSVPKLRSNQNQTKNKVLNNLHGMKWLL